MVRVVRLEVLGRVLPQGLGAPERGDRPGVEPIQTPTIALIATVATATQIVTQRMRYSAAGRWRVKNVVTAVTGSTGVPVKRRRARKSVRDRRSPVGEPGATPRMRARSVATSW